MTALRCMLALGALIAVSPHGHAQNLLYDLTESGAMGSDQSIGACGDVNGDGLPDFLVGVPNDSTLAHEAGTVRLHSGPNAALLLEVFGTGTYHQIGHAVDGAGDVNADGFPDFLAGTGLTDANFAQVWSGADGSLLYEKTGGPHDFFGNYVAGLGDADQDGFDDFAIGATQDSGGGKGYVRVFSGQSGALLTELLGDCSASTFGRGIDGLGDVDGDGLVDLAVNQPSVWGSCAGAVKVFSLAGGILQTLPIQDEPLAPPSLMAGAGDLDGDALPDVLVAFQGITSCSTASPGSVKAYSGATGNLLFEYKVNDPVCAGLFIGVDGLGDLDEDGREDLVVGAWRAKIRHNDYRVDVISGLDQSVLLSFPSPTGGWYGKNVLALGDLNGDGKLEIGAVGGGAWIHSACSGTFDTYGAGCAGAGAFTPKLAATGCPNPGQAFTCHITEGFGGQPSFMAVGTGSGSVPLGGSCSLLISPLLFVKPLGILFDFGPGWGNRDVPVLIPPGTSGLSFTLQSANLDPLAPAGFAVSNGLRVEVQ